MPDGVSDILDLPAFPRVVGATRPNSSAAEERAEERAQELRQERRRGPIDPFTAQPGRIPFAEHLRAIGRIDRAAEGLVADEPLAPRDPFVPRLRAPAMDGVEPRRDEFMPRLTDVAPVKPEPVQKLEMTYRVQVPGPTGRTIDLIV